MVVTLSATEYFTGVVNFVETVVFSVIAIYLLSSETWVAGRSPLATTTVAALMKRVVSSSLLNVSRSSVAHYLK